ncbi:transmembrane protein 14C-like isoform X1 [Stegodyphus dumicola]|uniref:transmembrane protein 14C-like isoform X1 n=1 Tax=Stegodyphus dumicola TaxID=202533 RepID=UPI0015AD1DE1|nr:transmembrane protein 14C-like isoform X1 [Stegodyphus dumicola]
MGFDIISTCYALSVAAGGIIGYVKAGSTPSLVAGLAFGSILAYGAYQTSVDENNFVLSLVAATTLGGIMIVRFYNSGKFMPAGLIATLRILFFSHFWNTLDNQ